MDEGLYFEEIQSNWTTALFAVLALVFLTLFGWRWTAVGWKFTPGLFLFLGVFFVFYVFNYRTLGIQINNQSLRLKFGLIGWTIDLKQIQSCQMDDPPWWIKYGGAGVHLAMVRGSYLAFFNFLEFPRVLVIFRDKIGLVEGLSLTTRRPEELAAFMQRRLVDHAE